MWGGLGEVPCRESLSSQCGQSSVCSGFTSLKLTSGPGQPGQNPLSRPALSSFECKAIEPT